MRSWLLDKTIPPVHDGVQTDESRRSTVHPDGSPKTRDEVFMDSVLQFGHDDEPVMRFSARKPGIPMPGQGEQARRICIIAMDVL